MTSNISAATVTYFSELTMLKALIVSIRNAAEELYKQKGCIFDYYIIDNSNNEGYYRRLESVSLNDFDTGFFCLHVINACKNLGYGGGNNLVIDQVESKYHIVINPDVTLKIDSLCKAVDYLDKNDEVVMISPQLVNSHVVKAYPDCLTLLLRYLGNTCLSELFSGRLNRYQCDHLSSQEDKTAQLAGGCFQFMRTSLFKQVKGFDDQFFMYFEDFDLSIRAREYGAIAYVPSVKISHAGGDVGRKNYRHHLYFITSAIRFFNKHGWRFW